MTDTASEAPATTTGEKDARTRAIQLLARALWREQLVAPAESGGGSEDGKTARPEWKEKRKDYIKLATKLYKRLDHHGATLSAPPKEAGDDADGE